MEGYLIPAEVEAELAPVEAAHVLAEQLGRPVEHRRPLQRVVVDAVLGQVVSVGVDRAGEEHLGDAVGPGGLEDVEGSDGVGPEGGGVVGLGWRGQHAAEMVDRVRAATRDGRVDLGRIPKVAADDGHRRWTGRQSRGRRVEVEQRDARLALGQQDAGDLGAQEAGAARDKRGHRRPGASVIRPDRA